MHLTVLGSGTAVPHKKRRSAGFWLESSGGVLLLEISAHVVRQLIELDLALPELDAIWISHFHLDHIGGLAPFLFGTKHAKEFKDRKKPLRIYGPEGLKVLLGKFDDANDYKLLEQPFPLEMIEVQPLENFEIVNGLTAVAMSTPHTDESLAIHLRDIDDATMVYTADTGFTETLATFARKVGLLVIEASFPKDKPKKRHLELAEAMHVIRKAEPRRAMLTHLYPEWDELDFVKEVERFSPPCEVIEAIDGLQIEVAGHR
jgi:ribonuclease BN (tRNA processing enzyme)